MAKKLTQWIRGLFQTENDRGLTAMEQRLSSLERKLESLQQALKERQAVPPTQAAGRQAPPAGRNPAERSRTVRTLHTDQAAAQTVRTTAAAPTSPANKLGQSPSSAWPASEETSTQIIIERVDKVIVEKLEYSNNFGALGIKELTGKLNIGTNYTGPIPPELFDEIFSSFKPEGGCSSGPSPNPRSGLDSTSCDLGGKSVATPSDGADPNTKGPRLHMRTRA